VGLGRHVHEDLVQRDLTALAPPRHAPDRVEVALLERHRGVCPGRAVEVEHPLPALVGREPTSTGEMLDQAEQVGARRRHRPAGVVLVQPLVNAIAPAAVFLASEGSSYLIGNTLFVDGRSHLNGAPWAPSPDAE
jgi:hypothetical protein